MLTSVLPPSEAAITRSGSIWASAPKTVSIIRKPVSPRAAQAEGGTELAIVPGGGMTSVGREEVALHMLSWGSTDLMQVYVAARVNDSVLLMAPFTCGEVPVQSATIRSPCLR